MRLESVGYLAVPDKNKNSPPHTSRRQITPRKRGLFYLWSDQRPAPETRGPIQWLVAAVGGAAEEPLACS